MLYKEYSRPLALFITLVLLFNLFPVHGPVAVAATPAENENPLAIAAQIPTPATEPLTVKIQVDNADTPTLKKLKENGSQLLADYASFSLWQVSEKTAQSLQKALSVKKITENILLEKGRQVDKTDAKPLPNNLRQTLSTAPQLWLVQFVGPAKSEWLENLQKQGFDVIQYIPSNSYLVWGAGAAVSRLSAAQAVSWNGPYHPAYRLSQNLYPDTLQKSGQKLSADTLIKVTVQFYRSDVLPKSLSNLQVVSGKVLQPPANVLKYTNISLEVPVGRLTEIANYPDVVAVIPYNEPQKNDEVQGQIMAGNVTFTNNKTVPTGPGYLAWLGSKGFSSNPSDYPLVDVVDDGVDNGTATPNHPDFYQQGSTANPDRLIYNNNCTTDPKADGVAGHGNLNLGILGGYNDKTTVPYRDAQGYNRGLGIAPYARLAGTKIFNNLGSFELTNCGGTYNGLVASSYNSGAILTSNSWGNTSTSAQGSYDTSSQAYDVLTRQPVENATREMLHVFSAGNSGVNAGSIGTPGTAKNVLTVGAAENVRDNGIVDGCGYSQADNADDIIGFSSRGPTDDGRAKPDIMGPGTHVQGPATQIPEYNGSGICGGQGNLSGNPPDAKFYPNPAQNSISQTLYTWSSGTSHSTPAVAGATVLLYNYYRNNWSGGQNPSPAMLKALVLNTPRYMTGVSANDTLPSFNQGWGHINLGMSLDNTARKFVDQSAVFTQTGQTFSYLYQVADSSKPLRVTLAWSDAPGVLNCGLCLVNDLDLELVINGQTYKGNVFSGGTSVTGGNADARNNIENIYLPAGLSGTFAIRIKASGINGRGVPWLSNVTSQDFALVVYNATDVPPTPVLAVVNYNFFEISGNLDDTFDPGETFSLEVVVQNVGTTNATNLSGNLALSGGLASVTFSNTTFPNMLPGESASNTQFYRFKIDPNQPCTQMISFTHMLVSNGINAGNITIAVRTGKIISADITQTETPALNIPDNDPNGITSTLSVTQSGKISKLRVKINRLDHTFIGDLRAVLTAPSGKSITLFSRIGPGSFGSSGDNLINVILDDSASNSIQNADASPVTGIYQPLQALADFVGENINGQWKLQVADLANNDTGQLFSWSLEIAAYSCTSQNCPNPLSVTQAVDNGACNTLSNALQTANQTASLNNPVTVTININAIFLTDPPLAGLFINPGVTLDAGECSSGQKMIYASGVAGNLTLEGGVTFKNIWLRSVNGAKLTFSNNVGVPNHLICSKINKT